MDTVGGKYVRVLTADAQGRYRAWVLFRPEPQGVELDVLARVAGLHSGGGEASAEVRVRTLRLVRALKSMFDVWVEDRADFGDLLRGVAAVDEMWRADPEFEQAGPLTLDLLTRVVAAQAEPWVGVDQETARRTLSAAAEEQAARRGAGLRGAWLSEFVTLPALQEAAAWVRSPGAKAAAVDALRLSGP
ncbi:lonely Cys domain-containing protein, partial [Streptomyces sp. MCAF7]